MKKYILLFTACLVMTGCSMNANQSIEEENSTQPVTKDYEQEVNTANDEKEKTQEPMKGLDEIASDLINGKEKEKPGPVNVTIQTLQNEYKDQNGTIISQVRIDYPIITNDVENEGIAKINAFFQDTAQALYKENNTYATDNAAAVSEETITNDYFSQYAVTFEVKYNANGVFSILQNFSERYDGMEDANYYSTGYVFDIESGKRLILSDILSGSSQDINDLIGQAFLDSSEVKEQIKEYYKEELLSNTQYVEFYVDQNNLNFFYNPNTVAPFSEGMLKASIPLMKEDIFKLKLE